MNGLAFISFLVFEIPVLLQATPTKQDLDISGLGFFFSKFRTKEHLSYFYVGVFPGLDCVLVPSSIKNWIFSKSLVACSAGVFWARECTLGRHLGFGNCGGFVRRTWSRRQGVKMGKEGARSSLN